MSQPSQNNPKHLVHNAKPSHDSYPYYDMSVQHNNNSYVDNLNFDHQMNPLPNSTTRNPTSMNSNSINYNSSSTPSLSHNNSTVTKLGDTAPTYYSKDRSLSPSVTPLEYKGLQEVSEVTNLKSKSDQQQINVDKNSTQQYIDNNYTVPNTVAATVNNNSTISSKSMKPIMSVSTTYNQNYNQNQIQSLDFKGLEQVGIAGSPPASQIYSRRIPGNNFVSFDSDTYQQAQVNSHQQQNVHYDNDSRPRDSYQVNRQYPFQQQIRKPVQIQAQQSQILAQSQNQTVQQDNTNSNRNSNHLNNDIVVFESQASLNSIRDINTHRSASFSPRGKTVVPPLDRHRVQTPRRTDQYQQQQQYQVQAKPKVESSGTVQQQQLLCDILEEMLEKLKKQNESIQVKNQNDQHQQQLQAIQSPQSQSARDENLRKKLQESEFLKNLVNLLPEANEILENENSNTYDLKPGPRQFPSTGTKDKQTGPPGLGKPVNNIQYQYNKDFQYQSPGKLKDKLYEQKQYLANDNVSGRATMSSIQTRTPRSTHDYDSQQSQTQSLSQSHLDRSSIHTVKSNTATGTGTNSTGSNRILDAQYISGKVASGLHKGFQSKPGTDKFGLRQQLKYQYGQYYDHYDYDYPMPLDYRQTKDYHIHQHQQPSGSSSSSRLDLGKGQTSKHPHHRFQKQYHPELEYDRRHNQDSAQYHNQAYYNRNEQRLQYYDPRRQQQTYRSYETQNPAGPPGILKQPHLQYQSQQQSTNLWYIWGKNIKVKSFPLPLKEISPYKFPSFAEFLLYCTYDDLKYYKPQSYQDFYEFNQQCAYKHQERSKALNCPDTYIQDLEFGLQLPLPGQRHPAEIDVQPAPVEPLEVVARKYCYPNIIVMSQGKNNNQGKESEQLSQTVQFSRDSYQQQTQQDDDHHARINDSSVTNDSSSQFQEQIEDQNHVSDDATGATVNTTQASKSTDRIYIKFAERWSHLTMYQKHRIGVCEPCYFILKPDGCGREKKHKCALENLKKMQELNQGQGVCKEVSTVTNVISSVTGSSDIKGGTLSQSGNEFSRSFLVDKMGSSTTIPNTVTRSSISDSADLDQKSMIELQYQDASTNSNLIDIPPPCDFCHYCSLRRAFLVDKWRKKKNAFNPRPHGFWDYNQNPCQEAILMLYEPHLSRIGINVEEVMERIWNPKRDQSLSDNNSSKTVTVTQSQSSSKTQRRGIEKMEEGLKPWWNPNQNRNKDKI